MDSPVVPVVAGRVAENIESVENIGEPKRPKKPKEFLYIQVIDLFQPKEDGTTLTFGGIALRLGLDKRRRNWSLEQQRQKDLQDLALTVINLTGKIDDNKIGENVLYERKTHFIEGVYMLNPQHLWSEGVKKNYKKFHADKRAYEQSSAA